MAVGEKKNDVNYEFGQSSRIVGEQMTRNADDFRPLDHEK